MCGATSSNRCLFDFYDQISVSRHYPSLEQTNFQARGIGSNISFWNRLRAICPKGVTYNGPILNSQGDHCTTSCMLDEAMLDTQKFWFDEPLDHFQEWKPVLREYQTATSWPSIDLPQKQDFLHTLLGTKDSAPGPDGIPYSAWRLSPEDRITSCPGTSNGKNNLRRSCSPRSSWGLDP